MRSVEQQRALEVMYNYIVMVYRALARGAVEGSYREAAEDSKRAENGSKSLEEMQRALVEL